MRYSCQNREQKALVGKQSVGTSHWEVAASEHIAIIPTDVSRILSQIPPYFLHAISSGGPIRHFFWYLEMS